MVQNGWTAVVAAGIIALVRHWGCSRSESRDRGLEGPLGPGGEGKRSTPPAIPAVATDSNQRCACAAPVPGGGPNPGQDNPLGQDEVKNIVNQYLLDQDSQKKAAADAAKVQAEQQGYKIGSELSMSASWENGLVIATPNNDFSFHLGGWIQFDNVFFSQSPGLLAPQGAFSGTKQGVASGAKQGGIGDLEDGTYFRRIRLETDGAFFENYEYHLTMALENIQYSTVGLEEFWVGVKDVPLIGTIRLGHFKTPVGLEAGNSASSVALTFMEESSYSEAIELNQPRVTGLWLGNSYLDQRTTYTFAVFRQDLSSFSGAFFGDGQYGWQGRLTALPIWEDDGRCWMHVGLSGGWRNGTNNLATSPLRTFELRARPELRDDDPAGLSSGAETVPNSNDSRMVDTGVIAAEQEWLTGLEFCYVAGPFSVQAEYGFNWLDNADGINPSGLKLNPALTPPQNYTFTGGYVQLAYTLTGESRSYNRRLGRFTANYFGPQGPYNSAWFVRDDDGRVNFNWGAWEIAARYSYVNLNSGTGLNTIQGGVMNGYTAGLNWYLNTNVKIQFNYVYDQRSDLPVGSIPGAVQVLGMRLQFVY